MEEALLEVFRDLEIAGDPAKLTLFLSRLAKSLPSEWQRDGAREKEIQRGSSDARHFAFLVAPKSERPALHLYLIRRGSSIRVSNVTPIQFGQLSRKQYNSCIEDFSKFALPLAEQLGLEINLTSAQQDIRDLLSAEAFKALRAFSSLANMSSGASHPLDNQRWLNFLVLAHKSGSQLNAETLQRWLIEEDKWPDTEAQDLGSRFDFARDLLSAYDKNST